MVHLLGPAIDEGEGSVNTRLLRRFDVIEELIAKIPRVHRFSQTLHRGLTDTLPFQARRFETSAQFTMEVPPTDEATLWASLRDKTRNVIRRTRERCTVVKLDDPEAFVHFYLKNLAREPSHFDLEKVPALHAACVARDCGQLLGVRDSSQALIAAVFVANDAHSTYYLLSTRDPASKENGAVSLLIWEAIRESAARGLRFDFSGIASMGSARFFAGFGAVMSTRLTVHRSSLAFQLVRVSSALAFGDRRNLFTGEGW